MTNVNNSEHEKKYQTSEIRREFDVTARALRFYESMGLLSPTRRGWSRIYSRRDRARLKLVLLGKKFGFSLVEIKEILDSYSVEDKGAKQREMALDKCRAQLKVLEQEIAEKQQAMADIEAHCEVLQNLQDKDG